MLSRSVGRVFFTKENGGDGSCPSVKSLNIQESIERTERMKAQTRNFIEMAVASDPTISGEHRDMIMKAVNTTPRLPDKVCLNQNETAYVLSVTRQTLGNMLKGMAA